MRAEQTNSYARDGITKFRQFRFTRTPEGRNIRMEVKGEALEEDSWRGLRVGSPYTLLFKTLPTVHSLYHDVGPAQRKSFEPHQGETEEEAMVRKNEHIRKDVEAIFRARAVPDECKKDLRQAMDLVEDTDPMSFHWDVALYNAHAPEDLKYDPAKPAKPNEPVSQPKQLPTRQEDQIGRAHV